MTYDLIKDGFVVLDYDENISEYLQEIDEKEYEKFKSKVKPLSNVNITGEALDGLECEGGACPIR